MKMIQAIIRPEKFDDVMNALHEISIPGATAYEVKGFGRTKGRTERYRGEEMEIGFVPKIQLNIVINKDEATKVIKTLCQSAQTGKEGDGKVFVINIDETVRIRTKENGKKAI